MSRPEDARPKCRWCWNPCHPKSAVVIADHADSREIPDSWDPKTGVSALEGIYCSAKCVVLAWEAYGNEIDLARGAMGDDHVTDDLDGEFEDFDEEEDDWSI